MGEVTIFIWKTTQPVLKKQRPSSNGKALLSFMLFQSILWIFVVAKDFINGVYFYFTQSFQKLHINFVFVT